MERKHFRFANYMADLDSDRDECSLTSRLIISLGWPLPQLVLGCEGDFGEEVVISTTESTLSSTGQHSL